MMMIRCLRSSAVIALLSVLTLLPITLSAFASSSKEEGVVDDDVKLPWGDINVVVLTDVHSWVAGHGAHESPKLNIDYGDVLSFWQYLKAYADSTNKDLYFVNNGDWVDGTGISMKGDVFALTQILEHMPWDAMNIGNHELYHPELIDAITQPGGFVDWFGDRYITSNVDLTTTNQPIGNHYRIMKGKHSKVLTFGFLYNFKDHVDSVTVRHVETVVSEQWFIDALHHETYDAIVVLAHMHVKDPLVEVILNAIRSNIGYEVGVQFITGHTHIRSFSELDQASTSFEAGRYLDTVGFVSFPKSTSLLSRKEASHQHPNGSLLRTNNQSEEVATATATLFQHQYINANTETLGNVLGIKNFEKTPAGMELSEFIAAVRAEKGLTKKIGYINQTYHAASATQNADSLWGMFIRQVVPACLPKGNVLFVEAGGFRYDLFEGMVTVDDVDSVSPFNEPYYLWKEIPGEAILQMNSTMNDPTNKHSLPAFILAPSSPLSTDGTYNLITAEYELPVVKKGLAKIYPKSKDDNPERMSSPTTTGIWIDYFRRIQSTNNGSPDLGIE